MQSSRINNKPEKIPKKLITELLNSISPDNLEKYLEEIKTGNEYEDFLKNKSDGFIEGYSHEKLIKKCISCSKHIKVLPIEELNKTYQKCNEYKLIPHEKSNSTIILDSKNKSLAEIDIIMKYNKNIYFCEIKSKGYGDFISKYNKYLNLGETLFGNNFKDHILITPIEKISLIRNNKFKIQIIDFYNYKNDSE